MKIISRIFIALALLAALPAQAKLNVKYFENTAKKIWAQPEAAFDPATIIPDSLAEANSAVIIADLDIVNARHEITNSMYKSTGETNRTKRDHTHRVMVRLLDQSAVDHYSEFEIDADEQIKEIIVIYDLKNAFGARIHKPDGTIKDVDVSAAVEIAHGKKANKTASYKLAIPGLETGDVLEYFYYTEEMIEEYNLDALDFAMYSHYPVLHRELRGSFTPRVTVEAKSFNGVPRLEGHGENDRNVVGLVLKDIPAVAFEKYTVPDRQLPFVRINFLNNYSVFYHPSTARRGGFYSGIAPGTYYRDILSYFRDAEYNNDMAGMAARMVKNYFLKNKPDATPEEIAEAATLALRYIGLTDDKKAHNRSTLQTLLLLDTFAKLKVAERDSMGFAFFNPYNDVPTTALTSWEEPHFMVVAAGKYYDPVNKFFYAPGDVRAVYQSQEGGGYVGNIKDMTQTTLPVTFALPDLRYAGNRADESMVLSITDDNKLKARRSMSRTGMAKEQVPELVDMYEWIDAVEGWFDIPEGKRYKAKDRDKVERERELRTALADETKDFSGVRPDTITAFEITGRSILPGEKAISYNLDATFSDLVQPLGDDMVVKIGKLFGGYTKLADAERNRLVDAIFPSAFQESRTITLEIPEGYNIDEESAEGLKMAVNNGVGTFVAQPSIAEDGRSITITGVMRYKMAMVPLSHWPLMLAVFDAAADFSESKLVLTRQ